MGTLSTLVVIVQGFHEEIEVVDDFAQAIDKLYPINQPTTAIEARAMNIWTRADNEGRILLSPSTIASVRE